jgi:uncharacterized Rmd1/YagE family protein
VKAAMQNRNQLGSGGNGFSLHRGFSGVASGNANAVLAQTDIVTIPTAEIGVPVSVKAYYISRGVDIRRVEANLYGTSREQLHGKSVTITVDTDENQYISIFEYGSCVFFNIPTAQHSEHLRRIKEAAFVNLNPEGLQHTENYTVIIHDKLDKPSAIKSEHVMIRCLDSNNIVIIGTVMAQSVAMDYYAATVEEKLDAFMKMNRAIEESNSFDLVVSLNLSVFCIILCISHI